MCQQAEPAPKPTTSVLGLVRSHFLDYAASTHTCICIYTHLHMHLHTLTYTHTHTECLPHILQLLFALLARVCPSLMGCRNCVGTVWRSANCSPFTSFLCLLLFAFSPLHIPLLSPCLPFLQVSLLLLAAFVIH